MRIQLGRDIRRYVHEGEQVGRSAMEEALASIAMTEQELYYPEKHRRVIEQKLDNARSVSIMELFEELIGSVKSSALNESDWANTKQLFQVAEQKRLLGLPLSEAEVMSSNFQLLTAAKLFTTMQAIYALTPATYEQLFDTYPTPYREFDHVIPSEAPTVVNIKEAEEYPTKQLSDYWVRTKANKFGARVELTRETVITDKTGQVEQQAAGMAESAKYMEDSLACLAFQDSSNASKVTGGEHDTGAYYPENTRVALYRTSAGTTLANYEQAINKKTSANLLHWDAIAAALKLLKSMKNRNDQYINTLDGQLTLVVPLGLEQRARLLVQQGGHVDISQNKTAGTESFITRVPNPISSMGVSSLRVIVWPELPTESTASQSTWYLAGAAKKQWVKHQRWAAEFSRATPAQLGGDDFRRDVIMAARAGFNSGFRSRDDKYTIQNTHS